jgi:hypothetical protein
MQAAITNSRRSSFGQAGRLLQRGWQALTSPLADPLTVKRASANSLFESVANATQGAVAIATLPGGGQVNYDRKTNVTRMRNLAKYSWAVRVALDTYRDVVARAAPQVVPFNQNRPMSKLVAAELTRLLTEPNQKGEPYSTVKEMWLEDALVVSHGEVEIQIRGNAEPYGMYVLDAGRVGFLKNWKGKPTQPRYVYLSTDGRNAKQLPDMLVMSLVSRPTSHDPLGVSELEILDRQVQAILLGDEFLLTQIANPTPGGALNLGENAGRQDVEEVRNQIETVRHPFIVMGGSQSAGFIPFNATEREIRLLDKQLWFLQAVAAVFKLPMQIFGQFHNETNRASLRGLLANKQEGMGAVLARIEEVENAQLTAKFGPIAQHNCYITYGAFNYQDETVHSQNASRRLAGIPFVSMNEERQRGGLEKRKEKVADQPLIQSGSEGLVTLEYLELKNEKLMQMLNELDDLPATESDQSDTAAANDAADEGGNRAPQRRKERKALPALPVAQTITDWLSKVLPPAAEGMGSDEGE